MAPPVDVANSLVYHHIIALMHYSVFTSVVDPAFDMQRIPLRLTDLRKRLTLTKSAIDIRPKKFTVGSSHMRNKIPCSADRLSLLDPPMIQGVVNRNAFHLGNQYLLENRVRIVEADELVISSAVIGISGLYEQTIRLKDGHLVSKCSCSLPEEPMCRHCIAVLLEYHRWIQQPATGKKPNESSAGSTKTVNGKKHNGCATASSVTVQTADLKMSEVMAFIEWLQSAMKALEEGQPLPDFSGLNGNVAVWAEIIRNVEERRCASEEIQFGLEAERKDREAYVSRISQQLESSMAEVKGAQATIQQLQREATSYKDMVARVAEIASDIANYDSRVKTVAGELLSQGSQLDKLAKSFKEAAGALKAVAESNPE